VIVPETIIGTCTPRARRPPNGKQRRLRVERVKNRLHQQHIHAAVQQRLHLLPVGCLYLLKVTSRRAGSFTSREIVSVLLIGPMAPPRTPAPAFLHGPPGAGGRRQVQVADDRLQAVIRLGDGLGVEGVGLDDVRAGGQVFGVDFLDDLRFGEARRSLFPFRSLGWEAKRSPR
jgi:hypothetical protein